MILLYRLASQHGLISPGTLFHARDVHMAFSSSNASWIRIVRPKISATGLRPTIQFRKAVYEVCEIAGWEGEHL
jgi:hypothetical protein